MPKVVINRASTKAQYDLISERTKFYNDELRSKYGDKIRTCDIMDYLRCARPTVTRNFKDVRRVGGTKLYNSIDIARSIAEKEAGL